MVHRALFYLFILIYCSACSKDGTSKVLHAAFLQFTEQEKCNVSAYPAATFDTLLASDLISTQYYKDCKSVLDDLDELDMHFLKHNSVETSPPLKHTIS